MTILEASNNILKYFVKNDFATIEEIKKENFNVENQVAVDKTYEVAFKKLAEFGYCEAIKVNTAEGDVDTWVLTKPLDAYSQNLELDGAVMVAIADVLNQLALCFNGVEKVDSKNISQKEIENLVMASYELLGRLKEE